MPSIQMLIPDWSLPWLVAAALLAFVFGAYRLSLVLGIIPVLKLVITPILPPLAHSLLPTWALPLALAIVGLLALHGLIGLIFGRETASQFTGSVLISLFAMTARAPVAGARTLRGPVLRALRTILKRQ